MSCGVRCIASDTTSLPEVGGSTVEYIDPVDDRALGDAILRLWQDNNHSLPFLPAIDRAQRFTWDGAARKTREVLSAAAALNPALTY
jgi:glycosyltransferase involved in cell wall biosynthesis